MKAVTFDKVGDPAQVLSLVDVPMPEPGPGQVRIRVRMANINPSDTMFIRGMYGVAPRLPGATPGFEAMGVIDAVGEGVSLPPGMRVLFITLQGVWQEYVCIAAKEVIPAPEAMPDEIACQAFVNPFTAYGMLEQSGLQAGDYLLLTAGGSAFGKLVIQMAKQRGIHTIATVRRPEQVESLLALGATAVVNTAEDAEWTKTVYKLTGDRKGVQALFEAVGGSAGAKALTTLAFRGTALVYGLLSLQDTPINNGLLIFKELTIQGFWLSTWMTRLEPARLQQVAGEILGGLTQQSLQIDIEQRYPLAQVAEACAHADRPGRQGKILLDLTV